MTQGGYHRLITSEFNINTEIKLRISLFPLAVLAANILSAEPEINANRTLIEISNETFSNLNKTGTDQGASTTIGYVYGNDTAQGSINAKSLTFENNVISLTPSKSYGYGAIFAVKAGGNLGNASLVLEDSLIKGNKFSTNVQTQGLVYVSGIAQLKGVDFSNNSIEGVSNAGGAAVWVSQGNFTSDGGSFVGNIASATNEEKDASATGGAIHLSPNVESANIEISNTTFDSNQAISDKDSRGGALYSYINSSATTVLKDVEFKK